MVQGPSGRCPGLGRGCPGALSPFPSQCPQLGPFSVLVQKSVSPQHSPEVRGREGEGRPASRWKGRVLPLLKETVRLGLDSWPVCPCRRAVSPALHLSRSFLVGVLPHQLQQTRGLRVSGTTSSSLGS